ncbi:unnamed protein product [Orchesella dallaii]|uniref:Uncharacterized protein n=1 Tax=Orchesella dallaii TaxID=48710 RepID=A0ABP1PQD3_9HEXA
MEFLILKSPSKPKSKWILACLFLTIVYYNCHVMALPIVLDNNNNGIDLILQTGENGGNNFRISALKSSSPSVLHDDLDKNKSVILSKVIKVHGKMFGSYLLDGNISGEADESNHSDQAQVVKTQLHINRLIPLKESKELRRKQNTLWRFSDREVSSKAVSNASEPQTVRSKSLQSTSTVKDSTLNSTNTKLYTTEAVERQSPFLLKSSRMKRSPSVKGNPPKRRPKNNMLFLSTTTTKSPIFNTTPVDNPITSAATVTSNTPTANTDISAAKNILPLSSTSTTTTSPISSTTRVDNAVTLEATATSNTTTPNADTSGAENVLPLSSTTTTKSPISSTTPVDKPVTSASTATSNNTTTPNADTSGAENILPLSSTSTTTTTTTSPISNTTPLDNPVTSAATGTNNNTTTATADDTSASNISLKSTEPAGTTITSPPLPSPPNSLSDELSKTSTSTTPIPSPTFSALNANSSVTQPVTLLGHVSNSSCNTTSNSSVTAAASSFTSTNTIPCCSSECDLWPWVLFLIFLCLLIIFMLMFLQCFLTKLLKTVNVANHEQNYIGKEYVETFPQSITTEAEGRESHSSSSSSKRVSSNKVDKICVPDNEEVPKSLENTKNTSEKNLWNIDNDLLRSSGQNQHSYMEYKKILRAYPRSDSSNRSSTTAKVAVTLEQEADHQKMKDLHQNELLPRDFKSTSNSSSMTTNYNIIPYETFSTSSYSKHSETSCNKNNSLSVPPSTPSQHEQTEATIVKVVPRAYQLNSVSETITSNVKAQDGTTGVSGEPVKTVGRSRIPMFQEDNATKMSQSKMLSLSDRDSRKMETEKLKREFFKISSSDNEKINNSQCNSFMGTYNRLQKRSEIERHRSKSGEKRISCNGNSFGTAIGEGVSSATSTIVTNCNSVTSLPSATTTTSRYYTYSKQGKGMGECVLIINKEEGWFKLSTGSESPGNVTKVHKIIQIDSKQSLSSSEGENDMEKLNLSGGVSDTWC